MSEATLAKIQKDCAKMEAELAIYQSSATVTTACESIITFMKEQPEPLYYGLPNAPVNEWHASGGGGGGGCSIQ